MKSKRESRSRIKKRIRKSISGTDSMPRLAVFRSNKGIYCQLIDDLSGRTLTSASSREVDTTGTAVEVSKRVGSKIAEKAKSANISDIVFDRSGYIYHGRIKALAEGAREGGLNF
jgi:large subunit ribosomal protein L18